MLFNMFSFNFSDIGPFLYYLRNYAVTFIFAGILSTPVLKPLYEKICTKKVVSLIFFGFILFISIAYLVDATYNPFLYFRF